MYEVLKILSSIRGGVNDVIDVTLLQVWLPSLIFFKDFSLNITKEQARLFDWLNVSLTYTILILMAIITNRLGAYIAMGMKIGPNYATSYFKDPQLMNRLYPKRLELTKLFEHFLMNNFYTSNIFSNSTADSFSLKLQKISILDVL